MMGWWRRLRYWWRKPDGSLPWETSVAGGGHRPPRPFPPPMREAPTVQFDLPDAILTLERLSVAIARDTARLRDELESARLTVELAGATIERAKAAMSKELKESEPLPVIEWPVHPCG